MEMTPDGLQENERVMIDTGNDRKAGNGHALAAELAATVDSSNGSSAAATPMPVEELSEWIESFEYVLRSGGTSRAHFLLNELERYAHQRGMAMPFSANTPYVNTIPRSQQPVFPGRREIERRIKSIIRWNAMAMVVRANKASDNIGGHISSFASGATLIEVAQNHFLRGPEAPGGGDIVYFQGHSAPGMYARAFLEGRVSERQLENFRRELSPGGGLSSYPHPWLMPDFWFSPSVSMGLTPIMSIYQARFNRYLHDRRLHDTSAQKVWAFLGDGEMDEPESLGSITLAAREKLDNLIWVINCNLQRLDGPVRGNGKIIQELEAAFRGAGWNVIKVIWGEDWDPLLEIDNDGVLVRRMNETVDGQYQKYTVASGDYIRQDFFGADARLLDMVRNHSDEQLRKLRRGGHDPEKVYAAYQAAVQHRGAPTVILAQTIKGYGLGESGEGKNITHQQKKLNEDELATFRTRFGIPISDDQVAKAPFYRPPEDSEEMQYLHQQRRALGGYLPHREPQAPPLPAPPAELFEEFYAGTDGRKVSTTTVFVRILSKLLRDKELGKLLVPIVPDEARTFGMETLFRQVGIYSSLGQLYEPVDRANLLYYREATDGQVLEEGITEAGSFSSFIAAGTAYATHGINIIPFYIFYSMFGFQRVGDLIWAAGDMRAKGFFLGGTAGRTTLNGEGLQHQDGHSHVAALSIPNLKAYDPAYAYELAVIIRDGIDRMFVRQESLFYYLTVMNENYAMPAMPEGAEEGILRGIYRLAGARAADGKPRAHLLGSGTILNQTLAAAELLRDYGVVADVWSVTSYKELYNDINDVERWNTLHPGERRQSYLQQAFAGERGVCVAASDYLKILPRALAPHLPGPLVALGTDGFGRSETREALRDFFQVDARHIAVAALSALADAGEVDAELVEQALADLNIEADAPSTLTR